MSTLFPVSFLSFNIACALNASYNYRKEKMEVFRTNVAILKAAAAAGKDWRAQLRDSLKTRAPEFEALIKKKRRVGIEDTTRMTLERQVDPDLL